MMYNFIRKNIFLVLLLFISFVSHWYIFFDDGNLNSGDWVYHFSSTLHDLKDYNVYASAYGLGTVSVFASNWVFYSFYYLFDLINVGWDIGTRIIFLVPIVFFTPFFSFLLFKKIFQNDLAAFFGACVYSFNTFFLKLQLDWITYAFLWWIVPALFLSVINYLDTKKEKYLVYSAMLVFFGIAYELRITILTLVFLSWFQLVYFVVNNKEIKEKLKVSFCVIGSFLVGILGHAFWIFPIMMSNIAGDVMENASPTPFTSFYDILDVFTLHMYSWSHNLVLEPFVKQSIEFRHFLIPSIAIFGLIVYRKISFFKENFVFYAFFSSTLVVAIFLGKQEFLPLVDFYGWAFRNIPLFNLYRESSKFFIFAALPLAFFFGIGLYRLYEFIRKYAKGSSIFIIGAILFFSVIFNLQHFIDQKIGGMTKGSSVPNDYSLLERKLSNESDFYRILWLPIKPRYGFYSQEHPFINAIDLPDVFSELVDFVLFDNRFPIGNQITDLLERSFSDKLLDKTSIKYVIIPIVELREKKVGFNKSEFVEEMYEYYGDREFFIKKLDSISYLHRIDIGTEALAVYENRNYRPHIYATHTKETIHQDVSFESIDFQFKNPTEYLVTLKSISGSVYVNFSEKYHTGWSVRIGGFDWFDVLMKKNYFLSEKYHTKNDAELNSFLIDPEYIKKNFPKDQYHENPDGSIDLNLTLYFKPQSYFYLGLIISSITLIICIFYLGFTLLNTSRFFRKKNE